MTRKEYKQQRKMLRRLEKDRRKAEKQARKMQAKFGKTMFTQAVKATPLPMATYAEPVVAEHVNPAAYSAPPMPMYAVVPVGRKLVVMRTHDIDENDSKWALHGIIRVVQGEIVELLQGTLETGLPPPYVEYVLIRTLNDKTGKVGRLCFA